MTSARVVAIGGGHGLSVTLRAVARWADHVMGIVSTADDGGSSGRLRESWDGPALGDVRRCLTALATSSAAPDAGDPSAYAITEGAGSGVADRAESGRDNRTREALWARALERRFASGDLKGHALGNLILLALTEELGDLQAACDEVARTAGIDTACARVVPVTGEAVVLCGRTTTGAVVEGQVAVATTVGIDEVWVTPEGTEASPLAIEAIHEADLVVLGPGSLYTSLLAAAVVGDVRKALADTSARVAYVANLRAEQAEARDYDLAAHVAALRRHGIHPHVVLTDPCAAVSRSEIDVETVEADLADERGSLHSSDKLAAALHDLAA